MASAEAMLQLGILILTLSLFFLMYNIRSQTTQARTRTRNKNRQPEPNRHMTEASLHLARARARSTSHRAQHARNALVEANRALSISPRDPSVHILRARALQFMGHNSAAIRSLDYALSPQPAKYLSPAERADALVTSAELKLAVNRRRRIDSAMEDLVEAMGVSGGESDNSEALCLLGKCYEWKGRREEARNAFQMALDVEPDLEEARNGLDRLGP